MCDERLAEIERLQTALRLKNEVAVVLQKKAREDNKLKYAQAEEIRELIPVVDCLDFLFRYFARILLEEEKKAAEAGKTMLVEQKLTAEARGE